MNEALILPTEKRGDGRQVGRVTSQIQSDSVVQLGIEDVAGALINQGEGALVGFEWQLSGLTMARQTRM